MAWQQFNPRWQNADPVQTFVEFSLRWLGERRYTLVVDPEMARWVEVMRSTARAGFINPAFDPAHSRLSPKNSFWIDIRSGSSTIATSAARLLITDDYMEMKRSLRLWYEDPPREYGSLTLAPTEVPLISGRVGHEGGLWVHPEFRKQGLSVILPHLNRALCLRGWDVDWQTGIVHRGIAEHGLARHAYGFPRLVQCSTGYFPVTQKVDPLYLVYLSKAELLAGIDLDAVSQLLPNSDRQPMHATIGVLKG
jgi:hypothetical protein